MNLLKIEDLETAYGNIVALKGVSFEVKKGDIVTIIGANGAGKTTLLHTISGLIKPRKGKIIYEGEDITKWSSDRIVMAGIAQVPEGRQIFSELTVLENLKMGAFSRKDNYQPEIEAAFTNFPRLKERMNQMGGSLSGGEQQMLAMARALMSKPKLLLLDEPSMGLAPVIVADIFKIIREINEQGTTIVLIEQNAKLALKIANYVYVLEIGKFMLAGSAKELSGNEQIKALYLGGE